MKKTYILTSDEKNYILTNTNPGEKRAQFIIPREDLKFDTSAFFDYVFYDIECKMTIDIQNGIDKNDKVGNFVYKTISEITEGVMGNMNEKCFSE